MVCDDMARASYQPDGEGACSAASHQRPRPSRCYPAYPKDSRTDILDLMAGDVRQLVRVCSLHHLARFHSQTTKYSTPSGQRSRSICRKRILTESPPETPRTRIIEHSMQPNKSA